MTLCVDGALETRTCLEACEEVLGFEVGPCDGPDGCACGDVLDEECAMGVNALCACAEGTEAPCTQDEAVDLYIGCFQNDPPEYAAALRCLVDYVDEEAETVDCEAGLDACAPEE